MTLATADVHEGWLSRGKRVVASGEDPLATTRDDAAFALALTIAEICDRYYLSENTVKNHLHGAFRTLGLSSLRHQARLGRACYLLGRYDVVRAGETGVVSRES